MLYLLVAALGVGPLFQLPMLHLQASMPQKDMATSSATLALLRSIGGTVGISVVGAIYANRLESGLAGIQGYSVPAGAAAVGDVQGLTKIEVRSPWRRLRLKMSGKLTLRRLNGTASTNDSLSKSGSKSCAPTPTRSRSHG